MKLKKSVAILTRAEESKIKIGRKHTLPQIYPSAKIDTSIITIVPCTRSTCHILKHSCLWRKKETLMILGKLADYEEEVKLNSI